MLQIVPRPMFPSTVWDIQREFGVAPANRAVSSARKAGTTRGAFLYLIPHGVHERASWVGGIGGAI